MGVTCYTILDAERKVTTHDATTLERDIYSTILDAERTIMTHDAAIDDGDHCNTIWARAQSYD